MTQDRDDVPRPSGEPRQDEPRRDADARIRASDLHDSVGQLVPLARMKLEALIDALGDSPQGERAREVARILALAEEQLRTLAFQVSDVPLDELGLEEAAVRLARDLRARYGLDVSVEGDGRTEPLEGNVRALLFRGLRELLINVTRHAGTDRAEVRMLREPGRIVVAVNDGGTGFDAATRRLTGFGITHLDEQLERLGGKLEIDSTPGRGTRVRMLAPLADDPGEG